jgi:hypothetical protein
MDIINFVLGLLGSLSGVPYVGQAMYYLVLAAAVASGAVTAFVAIWHALVVLFQALALIPGLSSMAKVADFFKTTEDKISGVEKAWISPILNRLSAIPLPKKPE